MIRTVKSVKDFSQYDTRWASKGYEDPPSIMSSNGCGPTAAADIIASNPNYKNITPNDTRKWLINHDYVVNGSGTIHEGIPAILKAYGFSVKQYLNMSDIYKQMAKGKRRAIFLMNSDKAPDGKIWTQSGHFVAIKGYKTAKGKHYFYVCDPGQRMRDGWACYETQMKGCISKAWLCYLPSTTLYAPILPKRGYFKKGDKGKQVKRLQKMLRKAGYSVNVDGVFGSKTLNAVQKFKKDNNMGLVNRFGRKALRRLVRLTGAETIASRTLASYKAVFEYMKRHGFRYKGSWRENARSWKGAKKRRTSNCSSAIYYSLKREGILKDSQLFWLHNHDLVTKGAGTRKRLLEFYTLAFPDKRPEDLKIKKGTICGYGGAGHTQAYAKRNKHDDAMFFSFGSGDVGKDMPRVNKYSDRIITIMLIPK